MTLKQREKDFAIKLRKQGKTYSEILQEVPVAKSTLSLWLRDVGLAKAQKQKLTKKKKAAQQRGGDRRREMRLDEISRINKECLKDIQSLSDREKFMIGVALYWAEGSKSNPANPSVPVDFGNSDPEMLKFFLAWLFQFGSVKKGDVVLRLHVHENHKHREIELIDLWSDMLGIPSSQFMKSNFKKHNPKTNRTKIYDDYIGLVSVRVRRSVKLNRSIMGWVYAIIATQK